jgi:hypothetical protein
VTTLDDVNAAARLKEVINALVDQRLAQMAPSERYATITGILGTTATVVYPDEPSNPISLPLKGYGPYAVGQIVRVVGQMGARYIDMPFTPLNNGLGPNRKNLFDNGRFKVHRADPAGTTPILFNANTGGHTNAERWYLENQIHAQTYSYGGYPLGDNGFSGSVNSMIIQNNGLAAYPNATLVANPSDYLRSFQKIEGNRLQELQWGRARALPLTCTYWIYSLFATTMIVEAEVISSGSNYKCSKAVNLPSGFSLASVTFPPLTAVGPANDNATGILIANWLVAGTTWNTGNVANLNTSWTNSPANNTRAAGCTNPYANVNCQVMICDAQAEIGSVFTGFEDRSYADTLTDCNRQMRFLSAPAAGYVFGMGQVISSTVAHIMIPFDTPMRGIPSTALVAASNYNVWSTTGTLINCTAVAGGITPSLIGGVATAGFPNGDVDHAFISATTASGQGSGSATIFYSNSASASILFDARL